MAPLGGQHLDLGQYCSQIGIGAPGDELRSMILSKRDVRQVCAAGKLSRCFCCSMLATRGDGSA